MENFDLIVLGGGPAGYNGALRAAENGLNVLLVEKDKLGGTCLNRGCIPTKSLLKSAEVFAEAKEAAVFGVDATATYDQNRIYARKDTVTGGLRDGISFLLKKAKVTVVQGEARFSGEKTVTVTADGAETEYCAKNVMIATGSAPARLPIPGIEFAENSDGVLSAPVDADDVAIIGGGVIGLEFASYFSLLNKRVTIIEAEPRILPLADRDVSNYLALAMKKRGVKILTSARVLAVEKTADGAFAVRVEYKGAEQLLPVGRVIVGVGRVAQFKGLSLEKAGIKVERRILVDENFETSAEGVYAVGDVSSAVQLAHLAEAQALNVADRICGKKYPADMTAVPSCVYTSPEVAWVGKTEGEGVVTTKFNMAACGKAVVENCTTGFVKLAFDAQTKKLVGAAIMCSRATDMLSELSLALVNGLTAADLISAIHPHPTLSEAVRLAAEEAEKKLG